MPNGWRKNAKYFDTSMSHMDYTKAKNKFRQWKKKQHLKDNYAPFAAEQISDKVWAPPTDYLCGFSHDMAMWVNEEWEPISDEDHQNWALYLKAWKRKMSNQTFRHRGCKPNCRICSWKGHGYLTEGERKSVSKKPFIDINIKLPKPKLVISGINNECSICYESKPEHTTVQLHCSKSQKNKYYICVKCRDNIYNSEYNSCPMCRKHAI